MEIFHNFLYQIIFTVGVIAAFGIVIALCRKAFYKIVGDKASKILLATGVIGTPIHELSHALMCLIFGHRITEIKLYQIESSDGTLGYVKHTYNKRNIYHQIGNFFIGVAPILIGSGVLLLLMFLLVPSTYDAVMTELNFAALLSTDFFEASTYTGYFSLFGDIVADIFDFVNVGNVLWWIFIILAVMIASHMELSLADIKSSAIGFGFIAVGLLIADIIMYFVSQAALEATTAAMTSFSVALSAFLAVSAIFSGITVLFGFAVKGIEKIIQKVKK